MATVAELLRIICEGTPAQSEPAARELKHRAEQGVEEFRPHHRALLKAALETEDLRTRWNLIVVLGLLPLGDTTRAAAIDWLYERLAAESPFTRTFAAQSLANLSRNDARLQARLQPILERFAAEGTASMQARARKLLHQLKNALSS